MSMKKNIIAAVAATMAMGVMSAPAFAAWTDGAGTLNVADELLTVTKQTQALVSGNTAGVRFTTGVVPVGGKITVRLTNGAKFKVDPKLVAYTLAAGTTAGTGVAGLLGTAVGSSVASFSVTTASVATDNWTLLKAAATTDVVLNLDVVPAGGAVDITYETTDNVGTAITAATSLKGTTAGTPNLGVDTVKMAPAFTVSTLTAKSDQAAVAKAYKVTSAGTVGTAQNGTATVVTLTAGVAGNLVAANDAALITLSGNFAGIQSVIGTNIKGSSAAGGVTTLAGTDRGVANRFYIDAAAGKAYALVTGAIVTGNTALAPQFVWDAKTAQSARGFSVTVDGIAPAGGAATLAYPIAVKAATSLYSITRDGTFFTVNSVGPLNSIKLTDQNNTTGGAAITVAAFDAAGAAVAAAAGATAIAASVPANGTVTISGATLAALYPTAVRFDFTVDSADVNVSNVKKNTTVNGGGMSVTTYRTTGGSL